MHSGDDGDGRGQEAARILECSFRLLHDRDLVSCKRFAERAIDADPLLAGADEIIAVADVLLASQRRINDQQQDWYSILQFNPTTSTSNFEIDFSAIRQAYRRLVHLLHPDRNRHPGADVAFQLVCQGWIVLSDPAKRHLYDEEVRTAIASNGGEKSNDSNNTLPPSSFWTFCPRCFRAYEYEKVYKNRDVNCQFCQKGFFAAELPTPPPVVEGTDMYYSNWAMFPLGFPGCPAFEGVAIPESVLRQCRFPRTEKEKVVKPCDGDHVGDMSGSGTKSSVRKRRKMLAKRPRRGMMVGDGRVEDEVED